MMIIVLSEESLNKHAKGERISMLFYVDDFCVCDCCTFYMDDCCVCDCCTYFMWITAVCVIVVLVLCG